MSTLNVINVATITASTATLALANNSLTSLVSNAASSSTVVKVNTIVISNITTTAVSATVGYYSNATPGSGTAYYLAYQVSVPAYASLVVLDKSTGIYLPENTSVGVTSGNASGYLHAVCSYEVLA